MKASKSILAIAIIIMVSLTSCKKSLTGPNGQPINAGIAVGVNSNGGISLQLSFSIGSTPVYGNYWGYGNVPSNVNTSVALIVSKPLNQTSIAVFDRAGNPMGTVDCSTGDWRQCNAYFQYIQSWNYANPYVVLIQWDQKFTSAPWSGHIVG